MNANNIINDTMTLDEKLAAIDSALKSLAQASTEDSSRDVSRGYTNDPMDLLICDGCQ